MRPSLLPKTLSLGLLLGGAVAFADTRVMEPLPRPDQTLQLAPYRVLAPNFLLTARINERRVIVGIEITEVTPHSAADRGGLHAGDELTAVDGKPIPGMKYDDLVAAISADFSDGHSLTYSFAGHRGLFLLQTVRIDAVYSLSFSGARDEPPQARLIVHAVPK